MKKLLIALLALTMLTTAACGSQAEVEDEYEDYTTQATTYTLPEGAVETTVEAECMSITIPASWYDQYIPEIIDKKHIYINHTKSVDAGYGGYIFSVEMFSEDEDYSYFPVYKYLNTVETKDGKVYDIVAVYPSDLQCPEELLSDYLRFSEEAPSVAETVKYNDDVKVLK